MISGLKNNKIFSSSEGFFEPLLIAGLEYIFCFDDVALSALTSETGQTGLGVISYNTWVKAIT